MFFASFALNGLLSCFPTDKVNALNASETFFVVWCKGGGAPTVTHRHRHLAVAEAERMARKSPDQEFVVLQATDVRTVETMRRTTLVDDIPF